MDILWIYYGFILQVIIYQYYIRGETSKYIDKRQSPAQFWIKIGLYI